jgi:hypothetical protein
MLLRSPSSTAAAPPGAMVPGVGGVEPAITLDQVRCWSDPDQRIFPSASDEASAGAGGGSEQPAASGFFSFSDPLTVDGAGGGGRGGASRFPVDQEINSKIYTSGEGTPGTSKSTPSSIPPTRFAVPDIPSS